MGKQQHTIIKLALVIVKLGEIDINRISKYPIKLHIIKELTKKYSIVAHFQITQIHHMIGSD